MMVKIGIIFGYGVGSEKYVNVLYIICGIVKIVFGDILWLMKEKKM